MEPKGLIITIDGPAGAGKSTIAKRLAKKLGYLYLDTGAMYRVVALAARRKGLSFEDEKAISLLAKTLSFELHPAEDGVKVFLEGEDVSEAIRTPEIDELSSRVASIAEVRKALQERQREIGRHGAIVAEGRDMGSEVFPDAQVKFFLTASPETRAKRRYEQQKAKGLPVSYEKVLEDIKRRDERDSMRKVAPLIKPGDAIEIDSSYLSPDEVLERIITEIEKVKQKCHKNRTSR
ncbi:(d)CMP kinase [Thermodesulfatator atlanticus]|uniref:(d)CMP kinase n=1 Tax=Thermodesulfatator atlanticus TaxID=501497 RepID=UPI0003B6BAF4|nr:(d)CMP kinase [Thermodesulfatator atlanticus]